MEGKLDKDKLIKELDADGTLTDSEKRGIYFSEVESDEQEKFWEDFEESR